MQSVVRSQGPGSIRCHPSWGAAARGFLHRPARGEPQGAWRRGTGTGCTPSGWAGGGGSGKRRAAMRGLEHTLLRSSDTLGGGALAVLEAARAPSAWGPQSTPVASGSRLKGALVPRRVRGSGTGSAPAVRTLELRSQPLGGAAEHRGCVAVKARADDVKEYLLSE